MKEFGRDQSRRWWALGLNLIAPGAGLVVLRREWLGLSLAVLFVLLAQVALGGFLLFPAVLPRTITIVSAAIAAGVWFSAQWLGVVRARAVLGSEAQHGVEVLRDRAAEALAQHRFAEARELLRLALSINDENLEVHVLWARLMTLTGQFRRARRAWQSVLRLDEGDAHHEEALNAIDDLPD